MHFRPKLIALVVLMSVIVGSSCAFFLWSLEVVTRVRFDHSWLLWLLPVAGVAVAWLYQRHGGTSDGGNNLILDRIHDPGGGVPRRMAPLVLFGTLVTHLFGGSAGREGTAVQMGGSIAGAVARYFRLDADQLPALLMAGVAAGFGAVFGTPLAGAVFAVEVVVIGRPKLGALPICLLAAYAGDWTCRAWGVSHERYHIEAIAGTLTAGIPNLGMLGKVLLAAVAFGLVGWLFAALAHWLSAGLKRWIPNPIWRPAAGGAAIIVLFLIVGRADYLGLGAWSPDPHAVTLKSLFETPEIHSRAWAWKLIFTAVTIASGFKGGEVTPLFFIGAALGNALAGMLGAPPELFAGLGMVAIFAGASNTPVASTLMGIELFGVDFALPIALACGVAFLCSGHAGIYRSQRFALKKPLWRGPG